MVRPSQESSPPTFACSSARSGCEAASRPLRESAMMIKSFLIRTRLLSEWQGGVSLIYLFIFLIP